MFFFEPQPFPAQEQPDCVVGDLDPTGSQLRLQAMQRQVRRLSDPLDDEGTVRIKHRFAVTTHLVGGYRAGRSITLGPFHN